MVTTKMLYILENYSVYISSLSLCEVNVESLFLRTCQNHYLTATNDSTLHSQKCRTEDQTMRYSVKQFLIKYFFSSYFQSEQAQQCYASYEYYKLRNLLIVCASILSQFNICVSYYMCAAFDKDTCQQICRFWVVSYGFDIRFHIPFVLLLTRSPVNRSVNSGLCQTCFTFYLCWS